ncbi:urease accessory protein UreD [Gordonia sp. OPL2]|uniref:urease accessory protein UreD n=1 Tax=Gordonia sp. OPL2 TaxID=2486274 RepID=UPI001655F328|nr:urease accessory protein UreD [Gordonia sp. OPL2]RPA19954.1 urease accessory protein UreD [Gordonia sp. OPL2]
MHTEIAIVARAGRSPRVTASGGLAVRQTGIDTVHLISTAATPLGGDTIDVRVFVESGASLHVETVAATLALPARHRIDSTMSWTIEVAEGARLFLDPQPTVVAAGADHRTVTDIVAATTSTVIVAEHAQLGRREETPDHAARARWRGSLRLDVGEMPVLRHQLALGGPDGTGHRAVSSVVRYPDERAGDVSPHAYAARLELPRPAGVLGATLTTGLASSAQAARVLCDELDLAPTAV